MNKRLVIIKPFIFQKAEKKKKKILWSLIVFSLICLCVSAEPQTKMTFAQGIAQSKPMALYLYADWADGAKQGLAAFNQMKPKYSSKYNFVTLNIADSEAKSFNKMYHIYPNLPYVLLFRDGTKFSRFVNIDCVNNTSCFNNKLDVFVN